MLFTDESHVYQLLDIQLIHYIQYIVQYLKIQTAITLPFSLICRFHKGRSDQRNHRQLDHI